MINVALIGGGLWAKEEHLPAIKACKHLNLVAVFSRTLKSAQSTTSELEGVELYSQDSEKGFKDLLQRPDIDAVIVALPIGKQSDYIREALLAGKHVLSEKPVDGTCAQAKELIEFYHQKIDNSKVTWSVAENWRFLASFEFAAEKIRSLGRILGFRVSIYDNIHKGWRFFETDWRKKPTHQGGFLLDSGVHYVAALRRLLGGDRIKTASAFTTLLRDHLPPVDTLDGILRTESGIQGTFQSSVGTSFSGGEWALACENGVVRVFDSVVTITTLEREEKHHIPDERTGVPPEIRAWEQALIDKKPHPDQSPEEALADLEILELMLSSGDLGGKPLATQYQ